MNPKSRSEKKIVSVVTKLFENYPQNNQIDKLTGRCSQITMVIVWTTNVVWTNTAINIDDGYANSRL